jgi:hypothetical protein
MEKMNNESGKGDTFRPVNKEKYDKNYLRVFGKKCPFCDENGKTGYDPITKKYVVCQFCMGLGYVEKK